jgi:phosphoketolase
MNEPLSPGLLAKMNSYWRAANYLSVGQISMTTRRSSRSM